MNEIAKKMSEMEITRRKSPKIIKPIDSVVHLQNCTTTENRKYWRFQEILTTEGERWRPSSYFRLQNETWRFLVHRLYDAKDDDDEHLLPVTVHNFFNDTAMEQFNVTIGLLTETGKELRALTTRPAKAFFLGSIWMVRSKLESLKLNWKEFIFFVEVKRKDDEKEQKVSKTKLHDFKSLYLGGRYSDFTIKVKDAKFEVHSLILGARSPTFWEMMRHEQYSGEKSKKEMCIDDVDPATFEEFLLYLYSGSEEHLYWKSIPELYKLGDKYCVHGLKELCIERVKRDLSVENFFDIFLFSQEPNNSELSEVTIQFFQKDPKEIIKNEKFLELVKDHPDEAYVLMNSLADFLTAIIDTYYAEYDD